MSIKLSSLSKLKPVFGTLNKCMKSMTKCDLKLQKVVYNNDIFNPESYCFVSGFHLLLSSFFVPF